MCETPSRVSSDYDGKKRTLFLSYCEVCGKSTWVPKHVLKRHKFCSRKCMGIATQKRVELTCDGCGKQFIRPINKVGVGKHNKHFCSRECKDFAQSLNGSVPEIRPSHYGTCKQDDPGHYRSVAFAHHPAMCNKCGYHKHPEVLEVHHIDRNRLNSDPDNLEILCPTCHAEHHFVTRTGKWTKRG